MKKFLWILTIIGSILGGLRILYVAFFVGGAWIDKVGVVTLGIALAVIPYCLARAVSEMEK